MGARVQAAVALGLEVVEPGLVEEVRAQVAAQVLEEVLGRVVAELAQAGQALEVVARVQAAVQVQGLEREQEKKRVLALAQVQAQVARLAPESALRAHESGCRARHSRWSPRAHVRCAAWARGRACVRV